MDADATHRVARADALRRQLIDLLTAMPYGDYLRTQHWQRVREDTVRRAGRTCQLCNAEGPLEVHHRTYVRRGEERPDDLVALCAYCHEVFHEVQEEPA